LKSFFAGTHNKSLR
jgi:hypothetical protein